LRIRAKETEGRNVAVSNNVSDTIERDILIAAPAEKVWQVVSIPGWWINDGSALELSLIERITEDRAIVHHPKHGDIAVERLDVDPPHAVSFRWLVSGAEAPRIDVSEDHLLHTRVTLTLTPEPGGTRLSVVESGFAAAALDSHVRRRAYEGNSEGWKIELGVVRAYVESA
jgi:uncharacterized protein YndB with AHSA1/START domain